MMFAERCFSMSVLKTFFKKEIMDGWINGNCCIKFYSRSQTNGWLGMGNYYTIYCYCEKKLSFQLFQEFVMFAPPENYRFGWDSYFCYLKELYFHSCFYKSNN